MIKDYSITIECDRKYFNIPNILICISFKNYVSIFVAIYYYILYVTSCMTRHKFKFLYGTILLRPNGWSCIDTWNFYYIMPRTAFYNVIMPNLIWILQFLLSFKFEVGVINSSKIYMELYKNCTIVLIIKLEVKYHYTGPNRYFQMKPYNFTNYILLDNDAWIDIFYCWVIPRFWIQLVLNLIWILKKSFLMIRNKRENENNVCIGIKWRFRNKWFRWQWTKKRTLAVKSYLCIKTFSCEVIMLSLSIVCSILTYRKER